MIRNAVIFAAGRASRMNCCSKAMKIVADKPLIAYGLDALKEFGIEKVIIFHRPNDNEILKLPSVWCCPDIQLEFIEDYLMQGAVMAHTLLPDSITYPLLTLDCDIILTPTSFCKMMNECEIQFRDPEIRAAVAVIDNPLFENSRCLQTENNHIVAYSTKGFADGEEGGYVFVWRESILTEIEQYYNTVYRTQPHASFLNYYLSMHTVSAMHIDYLWDVDSPEVVLESETVLNQLHNLLHIAAHIAFIIRIHGTKLRSVDHH